MLQMELACKVYQRLADIPALVSANITKHDASGNHLASYSQIKSILCFAVIYYFFISGVFHNMQGCLLFTLFGSSVI